MARTATPHLAEPPEIRTGIDQDFWRAYLVEKHSESELIQIVRVALEVLGQKRLARSAA